MVIAPIGEVAGELVIVFFFLKVVNVMLRDLKLEYLTVSSCEMIVINTYFRIKKLRFKRLLLCLCLQDKSRGRILNINSDAIQVTDSHRLF